LDSANNKYRSFFENSADAMLIIEKDEYVDANLSAVSMFGYGCKEEIINKSPALFSSEFQPDGRSSMDKAKEMILLAREKGSHQFEWEHIKKDGTIFPVEVSLTSIDTTGENQLHVVIRDLSKRKAAERALLHSEEKLRAILNNHYQLTGLMSADGKLLMANETALKMAGATESEVIGCYFWDTVWWKHSTDLQDKLKAAVKRCAQGEFVRFETTHNDVDGHLHVVDFSLTPLKLRNNDKIDYIIPEGRDITEIRQKEQALKESEEKFRLIVENQNDLVVKVDAEGRFVFVSPTYCKTFGKSEEELLGQSFLPLVHEEDRAPTAKAMESLASPPYTAYIEQRAFTVAGWRWLAWSDKAIVDEKGRVETIIGVGRDITDRKISEDALLAATQVAEAANHAKSVFLAKVSHEIRTPLTSIVGFGELMEDAEMTSEHRKYLSAINAASSTLSVLIDDIIDLSKIEAGELIIRQENFQLRRLIQQVAKDQEQQLANKNLSFNVCVGTDIPDLLVGDQLRIKQILLNLLSNAIKFTEKGSISLDVSVVEEGDFRVLLDISVKDTGIGIAADIQERVFVPFVQAFDAKTYQHSGSGLGLSISRSLAGLMGGTVELESQEGVGSTFHLLIPLRRMLVDIQNDLLKEIEPLPGSGPALNILLAEDNQINIQFIKTILEKLGHKVVTAENGKVALDQLSANFFDLVLMDIQMPVLNGIDALKTLRELEQISSKHQTVIALTAYALIGDREKYRNMGFDGYLKKPFTTRELVKELSRVIPG
jgi:PAS domain S-box-containing protein